MNQTGNRALRLLERALIVTALIAVGGCITWPYDSAGYYGSRGDPYDPYDGAYGGRQSHHSFDYGLYYGRPFYSTYGAYPHGYYYDPRFIGRVVRPVRPPATPPPAEPPPATPPRDDGPVVRPVPPRDWNPPPRPRPPAQPAHRVIPRATVPERNDSRSPHRTMPK